jgi:uncharacterized membrane protein
VYTLQWASMLVLLYFAEGIVRGMSDGGLSARLGWLEALLACRVLRLRTWLCRPVQTRGTRREASGPR